jgi:ectoine hydroxylase-related dioxygenase (phytanoyl-CoA dioxygenase family)
LLETESVSAPKSLNIGIFHETTPDPTKKKTGLKGEVYVTVALTNLNPENGLFIFLAKSHKRTSENTSAGWKESRLDLMAGDAVVWRGDMAYLHSFGGGGKFETLVFGG